jgi:hypothetical protein
MKMASSSSSQLTSYSRATLQHLQRTSPLDGYTIERHLSTTSKHLYRLKRRNVPIHDEGFLDLVVYNDCVVGLQVLTSKGDVGRGVVVISKDGRICNVDKAETITVPMSYVKKDREVDPTAVAMAGLRSSISRASSVRESISRTSSLRDSNSRSSSFRSSTTAERTSIRSNTNNMPDIPQNLTEADIQQLIHYGGMALLGLIVIKSILNIFSSLAFFAAPVLYLYAVQSCPSVESFDAKRELKRVMRGAHLPEEQQPKGFLERTMNRMAASAGVELATSLGYELSVDDYWGAGRVARVRVPVAGYDFYWIGAFGKLIYVSLFLDIMRCMFRLTHSELEQGNGDIFTREKFMGIKRTIDREAFSFMFCVL